MNTQFHATTYTTHTQYIQFSLYASHGSAGNCEKRIKDSTTKFLSEQCERTKLQTHNILHKKADKYTFTFSHTHALTRKQTTHAKYIPYR